MHPRPFLALLAAVGSLAFAVPTRADQTISYPPSGPTVRFSLPDNWDFSQGKDSSELLTAHARDNVWAEFLIKAASVVYPDEASCVKMLRELATNTLASSPGYTDGKIGLSGTQNIAGFQMRYLLVTYRYQGSAYTCLFSAFTAPGGKETYILTRRSLDQDGNKFAKDFKSIVGSFQPIR